MKIGYGITYGVWQLLQKHAILISYESYLVTYLICNAEMFKFYINVYVHRYFNFCTYFN